MKFEVLGEKTNPAILMLTGTLCSGSGMKELGARLAEHYYVILPTYDGCDGSGAVYQSGKKEAEKILQWLQAQKIPSLAMGHGTSMGAEVLMDFAVLAEKQSYPVKQYFFDGGPFFNFPKTVQFVMQRKFQGFADMVKGHDDEAGRQKVLTNPLIQKLLGEDTAPYQDMVGDMVHVCQTADRESIRNMTKTCYSFEFPKISAEIQKKFFFLWGEKEPARKSEKKIREVYPNARFRVVSGYMHCGYQICAPNHYVEDLKKLL